MSTPELTVVVTTRNRADMIDDTMRALAEQRWDGDWDVVIVDNGSTDATPEVVQRWLPELPVAGRLVHATERHNPSYSRNAGVAATAARSIAFVDDDDRLAPGWVAAIGTALRTHDFVGSRLDYGLLNPPALAATSTFQTRRLGRHFGAPIVDSAGSGCRRTLWHRVGGSDEAFRNGQDVDFSLRVARTGTTEPQLVNDALYHARLRDGMAPAYRRGLRRGRAEVQLFAVHGAAFGATADSLVVAVARWARLVLQLRWLPYAGRRTLWAENVGRRLGRLRASIRTGVWFP